MLSALALNARPKHRHAHPLTERFPSGVSEAGHFMLEGADQEEEEDARPLAPLCCGLSEQFTLRPPFPIPHLPLCGAGGR